ncbi:MAG: HprK-related kinase A [Undibacterium sp.]|nr:HprK-related kinase A [Undibacterium sp.]
MKVAEFSLADLTDLLRRGELLLKLGPFVARLKTDVHTLARDIALMYADFEVLSDQTFADFHVEVGREIGVRRWFKPQVRFFFDGRPSFVPLPSAQAFAMLEWGLNWCVAAHCHQYLIIHAAVIEKQGRAFLLPAPPGSGKSTLCAALVMRGWRLLSDELALYDTKNSLVYGMSRPINLKNMSIDVIKQDAFDAVMTASMPNTTKGTVALLRPPLRSVLRASEPARLSWIVLPKYLPDAPAALLPHSRAQTFMLIAEQSFNYDILGLAGFDAIGDLVEHSQCYQFTYSQLDDAERTFEQLLAGQAA